jgi:hypothetical protein
MKFILLLLSFTFSLLAIDLAIKPDINATVSSIESDQMITNFKKKRMIVDKSDAKTAVLDNRLLANALLKEKSSEIPQELFVDIKLAIEENLAEMYVKKIQETININEDVIASYYYTHQKDFNNPLLHADLYSFKTFEEASLFYDKSKNDLSKVNLVSQELNVNKTEQKIELSKISPTIKPLLKDTNTSNYILHPIFFNNQNVVVHVKNIQEGYYSLEESKEKIKAVLLQKVFSDTRENLLKNLKNQAATK